MTEFCLAILLICLPLHALDLELELLMTVAAVKHVPCLKQVYILTTGPCAYLVLQNALKSFE